MQPIAKSRSTISLLASAILYCGYFAILGTVIAAILGNVHDWLLVSVLAAVFFAFGWCYARQQASN